MKTPNSMKRFDLIGQEHPDQIFLTKFQNEVSTYYICLYGPSVRFQQRTQQNILHELSNRLVQSYLETGSIMRKCPPNIVAAFYDDLKETLVVGRDQMGIIPIYWTGDSHNVTCSTSSRLLVTLGFASKAINIQGLDDFLTLQYIASQYTMWRDVFKLPPGSELQWQRGKSPRIVQYWDISFSATNVDKDRVGGLDYILNRVYREIPIDNIDKELGLVSGGIDTSINVSFLTAHHHKLSGLTVVFKEADFDESYYAKLVAQHYGMQHYEIAFHPEALSLLNNMVKFLDEPIGDQAALATYVALSQVSGYTALYSGEGGDEIFGLPRRFSDERMLERVTNITALANEYVQSLQYLSVAFRSSIYRKATISQVNLSHVRDLYEALFKSVEANTVLAKLLYAQMKTWLVDNVVVKDRQVAIGCAMSAQFPLIHPDLVSFIAAIPEIELYEALHNKGLIRKVLQNKVLPETLSKRKHTFLVPMQLWYSNPKILDTQFASLLHKDHPIWMLLEYKEVKDMFDKQRSGLMNLSLPLWQILAIATWLQSAPISI